MATALYFAGGLVAAVVLWPLMKGLLAHAAFARTNYRDHTLPTAGGLVVVVALLVTAAIGALVDTARDRPAAFTYSVERAVLLAGVLGLLGLLDDLAGDGSSRGFKGHARALAQGRLTTGMVKLAGGGLVALVVAHTTAPTVGGVVRDALVIALSANLANLFDRAPGRTVKVSLVASVVIVAIWHLEPVLAGPALVLGATLGVFWPDLREELMLGDTGANVVGGALGAAVCFAGGTTARTVALVVLVALNAASEFVSFSKVINAVAPLRALDRLGRRAG
ncbi:MAG: hypothetical protein AB7L13_21640 [Acidimicrobiia bacterium]